MIQTFHTISVLCFFLCVVVNIELNTLKGNITVVILSSCKYLQSWNFLKLNHEIICFAYMKHISTQFNINSDAKGLIGDVQGCKDVMSYSCVGEYECSIEICYIF